jgi:curved DNA-binding protein CbpA
MKTPNLYDTLGVPRDAKPRDIKAAYRKRAAAAHPDKGGSDVELQAINAAWDTLGDPEKRRRYDETGEVTGATATMSRGEERFLQALDEVLQGMLSDRSEQTVNIAVTVKRSLIRAKRKTAETIEAMEAAIAKVEKQLGRYGLVEDPRTMKPIEVENFIESRLLAVKADLTIGLEGLRRDLSAYSDALVCCDRYRDANPPEQPRHRLAVEFWAAYPSYPTFDRES